MGHTKKKKKKKVHYSSATMSNVTNFFRTNFNGGTCWLKNGSATKIDAASTGDQVSISLAFYVQLFWYESVLNSFSLHKVL